MLRVMDIVALLVALTCFPPGVWALLRLLDADANVIAYINSAAGPLSPPFNISNAGLSLPVNGWESCRLGEQNRGEVVLVTMVRSPCTIQDWLGFCQEYQCLGIILHTLYRVPGLVVSNRDDAIAISEVSNSDGVFINDLLSSGRQLFVSMDSSQPNEWSLYFESREFIWAMTMPASAAACLGILNFFKLREKMEYMMSWRSIPTMHVALVVAESVELGFRSALGFGLGTTEGKGFSFEHLIWLINLVIVIYTMSNLTLGLALRDMYCRLMKQKPPLNAYLKVATFILCTVIFILHYVYNIVPRKTGNDQWRLPIIGQIWTVMVIGTVALFLISAVKLSISFRNIQGQPDDDTWVLRQVSIRLLQCAMAMTLDLIAIAVIAIWTYHSTPRFLLMSMSIAGWTQNLTSVLKMRAILVPVPPHRDNGRKIPANTDGDDDRSSNYLPVNIDEKSEENFVD